MPKLTRSLLIIIAAALVYLGWTFASRYFTNREAARQPERASTPQVQKPGDAGGGVKIVHFYASPAPLTEGEKALLCYGVSGARSVRLEPAIEPVAPSLNRCIEIKPEQDTRYTLTAEGHDGRTVSSSFVLPVQAAAERLPVILRFERTKTQPAADLVAGAGRKAQTLHTLCYDTRNAQQVSIDPPVVQLGGAVSGCFYVAPLETTTYTLIARDRKGRKAERRLTVQAQ